MLSKILKRSSLCLMRTKSTMHPPYQKMVLTFRRRSERSGGSFVGGCPSEFADAREQGQFPTIMQCKSSIWDVSTLILRSNSRCHNLVKLALAFARRV